MTTINLDESFRHTSEDLKQLQALPLEAKIVATKHRIKQWINAFGEDGVYVSFSGGKDSTALLYIVRELMGYSKEQIPAVFSNTGLEYAEIQKFAKEYGAEFIRPTMRFDEVISTYGYPIISKEVAEAIYYARRIKKSNFELGKTPSKKRMELIGKRLASGTIGAGGAFSNGKSFYKNGYEKSQFNKEKWLPACQELPFMITHMCCNKMKKQPMHDFGKKTKKKPMIATTTEESRIRKQSWLRNGCNAYDSKDAKSQPMAFWTEQDILRFIKEYKIEICPVYGEIQESDDTLKCSGCQRTGCVYCCFAAHNKSDTRFLELQKLSPRQFEYAFSGGQWIDNPAYDPAAPVMDGIWKNWNPKKIWVPSKDGLGLKFVIDEFNQLYPNNQIKY